MSKLPDFKHLADCENCPLKDRPYTPWSVPVIQQYPLLFIGQAPGSSEGFTKIPFTGQAGKMHYSLCRSAGLRKLDLPHSNTCACFPPEDRKPTPKETEYCFPRLKAEIHYLKPKLIVALGEPAMQALTGQSGITKNRGRFHPLLDKYDYPCKVLCCLHPSFVMRSRQWIPAAIKTYTLIHDFFNDTLPEDLEPEYILDPNPEQLREYLDVGPDITIAVDTETTGLNTRKDQIIGHSFCKDMKTAVAVKYTGPHDPRWEVVKEFLEDPKKKKCWQNGSYDTEIARTWGIQDKGFEFDTRLAQQLLQSDLPSDLDFLRGQYTNIPPYKPSKKEMKYISKWGAEKMLKYAALDAITTFAVMKEQQKLLQPSQTELMKNLLIPLVRAIGRMERRGCLIDTDMLAALYARSQPELERLEQPFREAGLNPRSPKQICSYFGIRTSGEQELKKLIKRNHSQKEMLQKLLDYRKLGRLVTTYLKGTFKRLENGRVHPHYKIEGTGTGRLASENPNQQNVPEEMRIIYIADPGHILVNADYSQLELWVGSVIAEEDQMFNDLSNGLDIHFLSCQACFPEVEIVHNDRHKDFSHRQQLIAKTVTFGTFYGRTARSIAIEFGVSTYEAEQWQMRILNKYPGLARYKRKCEEEFKSRGYLLTPFGRIRYITSVTQSYNFPIQSSASDITLNALVLSDRAGLWNWGTVHDSIVFQVPEDRFSEQFQKIREVMERPVPELNNVQFKAEYKKGYNWYEMEDIPIGV